MKNIENEDTLKVLTTISDSYLIGGMGEKMKNVIINLNCDQLKGLTCLHNAQEIKGRQLINLDLLMTETDRSIYNPMEDFAREKYINGYGELLSKIHQLEKVIVPQRAKAYFVGRAECLETFKNRFSGGIKPIIFVTPIAYYSNLIDH